MDRADWPRAWLRGRLDYAPRDEALFRAALTHRSAPGPNNERLEFLGDAVIGAIVTEYLYLNFPELSEGELSKYRAVLVRLENLYKIAENIKIPEFILKEADNSGSDKTAGSTPGGGKNKSGAKSKRIIGNVYEAVIGAVFLDSSYEKAKEILLSHLARFNSDLDKEFADNIDFKTVLQEITQKNNGKTPEYCTMEKNGPDHNASFTVCVKIDGKTYGYGSGPSKKTAEQNAARKAISKFSAKSPK